MRDRLALREAINYRNPEERAQCILEFLIALETQEFRRTEFRTTNTVYGTRTTGARQNVAFSAVGARTFT